jgi:CCR4-NOT transcription complex subunit 9
MIQTPHLFSHQQHYGHNDQSSWGSHSQQQSHQGLSHAQQHAQAQAAQAAAVAVQQQQQQQQQYNRIAVNQNHNTHSQNNARDNRQSSGDSMNNAGNNMTEQGSPGMGMGDISEENRKVLQWVAELMDPARREGALMELSKKREQVPELALVLWHSFGVMTSLLQEIISVYPLLNPSQLTATASNRVCNALALLQCVASHNETRGLFLSGMVSPPSHHCALLTSVTAHIPLFLYPFLNTTSKSRPFEYLRLTSLGVIGALVKNEPSSTSALNPSGTPSNQCNTNSSPTITFLLTTEIIPLCLRIMETGSELSKTVAIFIVQKILLDDTGLGYICATYERFYAVGTVLSNMVGGLVEVQTVRLLKHVVRCFLR